MQTTATNSEAGKLDGLRKAFGASAQLQTMFPSCDAFVEHMIKADFDSDAELRAEFPNAGAYLGYLKWAERKASRG